MQTIQPPFSALIGIGACDDQGIKHNVTQAEGEQGDPLMPLLFSIAIQQLCAFLDDVYALCSPHLDHSSELGQIPGSEGEVNDAKQVATLSMRMGRLGLRSTVRCADATYWASWADALHMSGGHGEGISVERRAQ